MSQNEEAVVKKILKDFVSNTVPEYILDGSRTIVNSGGVQKLELKKRERYWDVDSSIQGDDFQIYTSELGLNLAEENINHYCNCPDSYSGVCRHVGAAALKLLLTLDSEEEKAESSKQADWRQNFRSFFSTELEPEAGKHYIIYRMYPEPERLQVSFFRARQNKSGLSQVQNEVDLESIIANPEWSETSPNLPLVAEQIGHFLDYRGHRVDIPAGLHAWFFRAVKDEYYIFLRDTDIPIRIESRTMQLKLSPQLAEEGLSFDILLSDEGKPPFSIMDDDEVFFYGRLPLWVYWKHGFYPVQTTLDPKLVQEMRIQNPSIPPGDIPEFLDRVWTQIPVSDLYDHEEFLEKMQPFFVPAGFNPKLYLNEEGSLLTIRIDNIYETEHGEVSMPEPNPDLQTGSYKDGEKSYLVRRAQDEEAMLFSELRDMGFQPRNNSTWFMEQEAAITFLLDFYPQLVEAYRIYGEKNLTRYKVRLTKPQIVAEIDTDDDNKWFNLDITVEYDDQRVPIDKIWEAWSQGKRYVQLKDGSYTSLPESWLKKLSHKLKALGYDPDQPPRATYEQYETPILDKIIEDLPDTKTDEQFVKLREKIHNFEEIRQLEPPKGLDATLRPYQLQGLSYLNFLREYHFGGILADEMGLGKTIQTLSFLLSLYERDIKGPNLIIVPTSVLPNWEREAKKFVPQLSVLTIYGSRREELFKQISTSNIVITTYALLRRDLEELLKREYTSVILDEAQNIKNPNTITAKSVRQLKSEMRLCLSGTPIENNLFELWSLFEFLMPGFLSSQHAFQRGIIKPIKDGDEEALDYLRTRVKPFILRRTKSEVAKDLPPKIETVHYCDLIEEQRDLYNALAKRLRDQVLKDVDQKGMAKSQMSILDALLKLRQICCHPRLLKLDMPGFSTNLPSGKFDAFKDLIFDIVEGGHKVLVFSQFVQMLHIIRSWLTIKEIPFTYLDGSSKDRFEQVDKFNDTPEIPIFLISLKAGGTGLNLTSADYVIHYDPWWNPAVENQATDRTHRIGQKRQVFAYKLICQNTVEEKILKLQEMKKSVADAIIPGQSALKSLTRDDLEMLFEI
ncbi:Superfamily II DNA or RNA helicase, SNF2 family [Maridesulfovibrio ferrireducens]|uniref:Superfamily II DNA or RNA helicase, SNF2 family n=1 Tax=Maridesulfovibrio ferrireducens TaxID=246191 RepID=A0A1G9JRD5_9BACT|nr:DEAD/DEAH box helicase [Maridesulfovibrio ferrireducens]SDL39846.1 Superfamily II DNA or RNA helicase, SNF2 family [Maridesulfovibrio ferrireducens]